MRFVTRHSALRRFVGDLHTMEVHDASNKKPRCRLDSTIKEGFAVGFEPDSIERAHDHGFDDCPRCIGS